MDDGASGLIQTVQHLQRLDFAVDRSKDVVLLTGSATLYPYTLVNDFDIICLVGNDTDHEFAVTRCVGLADGREVECTYYPCGMADIIGSSDQLSFLLFREVKKVCAAIVLSDHLDQFPHIRDQLSRIPLPKAQLRSVLRKGVSQSGSLNTLPLRSVLSTLTALFLVTNYVYCPLGPVKSKWFSFGIENRYPPEMLRLVDRLQEVYLRTFSIESAHLIFDLCVSYVGDVAAVVSRSIQNIRRFWAAGMFDRSLFPFVSFLMELASHCSESIMKRDQVLRSLMCESFRTLEDEFHSDSDLANTISATFDLLFLVTQE